MTLLLIAGAVLIAGAALALVVGRAGRDVSWLGAGSVLVAAGLACAPAIRVIAGGATEEVRLPWPVPFGEFHLQLDLLSAWFLLPTWLLGALCAVYGAGYLRHSAEERNLGPVWFWYAALMLAMSLVLLARNAVLFLYAWEAMALTSFFLVTFDHHREEVREAGWIYLVASHLGTAFLLALFLLMARETGSMDFSVWEQKGVAAQDLAGVLFFLSLVGFGTKAGLMPFHVWLPEAHPAAPSHVSAVMSGVMIKTGVYGLLRSLLFLGAPANWWGWLLVAVGLGSAVIGIVFAVAQHDLKRLLAYSSVENVGLIALGLGLGVLGAARGQPLLSALGFIGALIHAWNHSLFKGLLFLCAGGVAHAAGSRRMDHLGGLLRPMPWTGALFLLGAVGIVGLPPLNGFMSELLLVGSAMAGIVTGAAPAAVAGLIALAGIGLVGGLAAAAFAKAFGSVFLGEPRRPLSPPACETGLTMRLPQVLLGLGCVAVVPGAAWLAKALVPLASRLSGIESGVLEANLTGSWLVLRVVALCGLLLVVTVGVVASLRGVLLAGRTVSSAGTWDCGYARPTARMQYTASSFSQPITALFRRLLGVRQRVQRPDGILASGGFLVTDTPDLCHGNLYHPAFLKVNWGLAKLRWLQRGQVQLYVLYIALTLIALLAWKFR